MILTRSRYTADGIFGEMTQDDGVHVCYTLEHAYQTDDGDYVPKVSRGVYTCLRHAPNRLPYETFELQNVPNFEGNPVLGILIHIGNFNKDSEGCILVGDKIADSMILGSKDAFATFMALLDGQPSFSLTIA